MKILGFPGSPLVKGNTAKLPDQALREKSTLHVITRVKKGT